MTQLIYGRIQVPYGNLSHIAKQSGLSLAYTCKVLKGRFLPSIPALHRLADALQMPPGDLLSALSEQHHTYTHTHNTLNN